MNKIISLLVFLILLPVVLGIETHNITYTIDKDLVQVQHLITTNESVKLIVPEDAHDFNVLVNNHVADFDLLRIDRHKEIFIPLSLGCMMLKFFT